MTMGIELVSMGQICAWLGIAKRTMQTWRQTGIFPDADIVVGKTLRWRRETVERWLAEQVDRRALVRGER